MAEVVDLFVYGTLKRGFSNHRAFCARALEIREATITGHLYELPVGYPAVCIPQERILREAGPDPTRDASCQRHHEASLHCERPDEGWGSVHGEWIRLPDPARTLPLIDVLEGVRRDGRGEYRRGLVPALTQEGPRALWVYWMPQLPPDAHYLPNGAWPAET